MASRSIFAIAAASALAGGVTGALTTAGFSAQAAHDKADTVSIMASYPTANPVMSDIWTKIKTVKCDDADSQLGMDPGTCAGFMAPCSPNTTVVLTCLERDDPDNPGTLLQETTVNIGFSFPGQWVPSVQ